MSLYGEFHIPAKAFALSQTLTAVPEATIETERVVATDELLTPYFWVQTDDIERFDRALESDTSIKDRRQLDRFKRSALYRATWTENTDAVVYAYTEVGATIIKASGRREEWEMAIRFDDRENLDAFQDYCGAAEIPFRLTKLHELSEPQPASAYDLTPMQYKALYTAWEMGYYTDATVTLTDVADELEITQQSLSERLQRGYQRLLENTIAVTPP